MAHFYAQIHGNKGEATRCGSKNSGIYSHTRGWKVGCETIIHYDEDSGKDKISIYLTSGSTYDRTRILIGTYTEEDLHGSQQNA